MTFLKAGHVMRVSDVAGAYALIPLNPDLWRFFLFEWWDLDKKDDDLTAEVCLYVHLCADFGRYHTVILYCIRYCTVSYPGIIPSTY